MHRFGCRRLRCRRFGCVAVLACRRFGCVAVLVVAVLVVAILDVSPFWRVAVLDVSPFWSLAVLACRRFGCRRFGCRRFGFVAVLTCIHLDYSRGTARAAQTGYHVRVFVQFNC